MSEAHGRSEFERLLYLDELEDGHTNRWLEASESERRALAGRLGLESLTALTASLDIRQRWTEVRIVGRFHAMMDLVCVVTLDPFDITVEDEIDEVFTTAAEVADLEVNVDYASPEPLKGDVLDLGEVVVQHLALAIDLHPRAPDAALSALEFEEVLEDPAIDSPFAILAKLRDSS